MAVSNASAHGAHQARRFSGKQLRAMQAIGLIPWIRRGADRAPAVKDELLAGTAPVAVPSPNSQPAPATPLVTPTPFRGWQLRAFRHGTREMMVVGPETSSLLILVEPTNPPMNLSMNPSTLPLGLPLTDADQKLLCAMLQAIELRLSDVRLASLCPQADARGGRLPEGAAEGDSAELASVLVDSLRAIIILSSRPEVEFDTPVSSALTHRSLPAWFCPHPAVLREAPEQKRIAWQILKAIRRQLGPR